MDSCAVDNSNIEYLSKEAMGIEATNSHGYLAEMVGDNNYMNHLVVANVNPSIRNEPLMERLQGKVKIPADNLILKKDVAEINTQWLIRFVMQVKTSIRKASLPKLSGTGITSPILSSPLLNCRKTAYQNSLPF